MDFINAWKNKIAEYLDANIRLAKLNFIQFTARVFGYLIFVMIGALLGFAILIYVGFSMAETFTVLADGSRIAGFFMTVGFYLLLVAILYWLRKPIIRSFTSKMIQVLSENPDTEDK